MPWEQQAIKYSVAKNIENFVEIRIEGISVPFCKEASPKNPWINARSPNVRKKGYVRRTKISKPNSRLGSVTNKKKSARWNKGKR